MKRLLVLLTISVVGCHSEVRQTSVEVRTFDDPFAADKSIPLYRAPKVAVLYVVSHVKRGDGILIGSHYVFVEPEPGRFIAGEEGEDDLDLEERAVIKIPASKREKELLLKVNWNAGLLKEAKRNGK